MHSTRNTLMVCVLAAWLPQGTAVGQEARAAETLLSVGGEVPKRLELTADGFAKLPRQSVRVKDPAGADVEYEGVLLGEVLKAAGVKLGEDLRGPALANYLMVEAADGYRAVFALADLDPTFTDRLILLADRRGGKPLDQKEGPLRVVIPAEKRHSRWVRQVVSLKVGRG
jgi:DMSO/TMAO reductase YedYZ molybdopterin-dependent catalytic subunit